MNINRDYNYEEFMLPLDDILDLIEEAIKNNKVLSLGRYGHLEVPCLAWSYLPYWIDLVEPHSSYTGVTASISIIQDALIQSVKDTDIVGFHASWGTDQKDKDTAGLTAEVIRHLDFIPKHVCTAFICYEMINSSRFWDILKERKIILVGRRALEASQTFKDIGIDITHTTTLEGYEEIEKVHNDLSTREDWDIALLSAGVPATILAPLLANRANKVVIDFGHALDKFIDGENFNYEKILKNWEEGIEKKMLVSMIMTVYNGEKFLKEAVDSTLAQTYENIEIILVNNGSTDSTKKILDDIKDKRVKIIHLERNKGIAKALNIGIKEAQGSWIAIQDADDNSYPTRIEEQVKYIIKHPGLVGVGTFIECISGGSSISQEHLKGVEQYRNAVVSKEQVRDMIFWGCPLTHSSVMFSKDAYNKVGGYSTDYKIASDYDLWLKLLEKGEMENVPKVLLQYRIHKESLSNNDNIVTLNEIQIASSRGIYRRFNKGERYKPKVVVIGPRSACINYKKHVGPASGLKVKTYIFRDFNKQVVDLVNMIKTGKIDAVIVLDGPASGNNIEYLKQKNLKLNEQIFSIYNFLQ